MLIYVWLLSRRPSCQLELRQQSPLQLRSEQAQSRSIDGMTPAERCTLEGTVAATRLRTRHHDSYEAWECDTRRDALVSPPGIFVLKDLCVMSLWIHASPRTRTSTAYGPLSPYKHQRHTRRPLPIHRQLCPAHSTQYIHLPACRRSTTPRRDPHKATL